MSFSSSNSDAIAKELRELDVNTLTPIEAMTKLFELANRAHKDE